MYDTNNENIEMSMVSSGMGRDMGTEVIRVSSSDVTVLVSGLDPFTNYTFKVLAVTTPPSEPSDNVTVLTNEAGNAKS